MQIRVKKLTDTAKLPTRGSSSAAGYDLYADIEVKTVISPHTTVMIPTGLSMEIPDGYFGAIFARSGLAVKEALRPANCVGVVDSDYRGEFMIALHNDGDKERIVEPYERIAQMVVIPYLQVDFEETDSLSDTERGEGGFGSTGTV
jgi:dUTP pyrophosphatase